MKNPCENCLVRSICLNNCKLFNKFLDFFINSFDGSTSIRDVVKKWEETEVRPNRKNGRVA